MKPAAFSYFRPASIEEALEQLASLGGGAKVIAGGQSLAPDDEHAAGDAGAI